jgi:hypothetical protein
MRCISEVSFALALAAAGAGCSVDQDQKAPVEDRFGAPVGDMSFNETAAVIHEPPPRYAAVRFFAGGGDAVDVRLESLTGGDPVAWLLDESGAVLAVNDDASPDTVDARIELAVPWGAVAAHYLVFRDYFDDAGVYRITLGGEERSVACEVAGADPDPCPAGFECVGPDVAIDGAGSCARTCGGFASLACPADQGCVDNPFDACDAASGADCTGLCQ